MSDALFEVIRADALASVQDQGRHRSFHHGITEGGVMDLHAALWANRLLGRSVSAAVIEVTLGLLELVFRSDCQCAITGADLQATLNGEPMKPWRSFGAKRGDILKFDSPLSGIRAYLAVNAKFDLPSSFDSVATVIGETATTDKVAGMGGGQVLQRGDCVNGWIAQSGFATTQGIDEENLTGELAVPMRFVPDYSAPLLVDIIPGYQFDRFAASWVTQFLQSNYQINTSSNRMAYRFSGDTDPHDIKNLSSEGIAYGAVQVPPDGQPVVLLNDRQTMGGYPKLGCVTRLSASALVQRFNPSSVRFRLVSVESARQELVELLGFFQ